MRFLRNFPRMKKRGVGVKVGRLGNFSNIDKRRETIVRYLRLVIYRHYKKGDFLRVPEETKVTKVLFII